MGRIPNSALGLVALSLAAGLAPDPVVKPSAWAAEHLIVADGPQAGQKWDAALTPQLVEILDCMATDHPCNRVSVRKSHQVGFTGVAIAWMANVVANVPARALVVFPTEDGGREFNSEKFHPALEETPELRRKVAEARSKSAKASTTLKKRFPGGTITITGANSTADLRSKTVKYVFADEIDEWPLDLNGQGDPMEMVDARQTAFHTTGEYKKLEGSTPTIRGASRIDDAFEVGDQRTWQVPCPHCGEFQRLIFKNLKFAKRYPYNAHYVCAHCGCVIEHHHKRGMVLAGRWEAEQPGPGRHPSFHLDTLTSLLTTWDKLAEKWWAAQDKPEKLKAFVNLWLGESWEERGDAPDWQHLFARRESYSLRTVPPGALVFTLAVDVQQDGLYYEVVGWGIGKTSWTIDADFLVGDTADSGGAAWRALDVVAAREYPTALGRRVKTDLVGVDCGFNSGAVYDWVRRWPTALALKGVPGWYAPPIGVPARQDVTRAGKKKRRGLRVWPVGTWPLKAEFYGHLRKLGLRDGAPEDPPGYCHFGEFLDERYFRQLTSEFLQDRESKGRIVREWVARGDNHFHDCRIYNMALADRLGISRFTSDEWARLATDRGQPPPPRQGDLLASVPVPPARKDSTVPVATAPRAPHPGTGSTARPGGLSRRLA